MSDSHIGEALARVRDFAPQLGAEADELNQSITEVEAALQALKLGVAAFVRLETDIDSDWRRHLCFSKEGSTWRLTISEGEPGEYSTQNLIQASREIRIKAVEAFPELLTALVKSAEREIHRVRQAKDKARNFAKELAKGGKAK